VFGPLDIHQLRLYEEIWAPSTQPQPWARKLYSHLSKRPDGKQVLFVYDRESSPTVRVTLQTPGSAAHRYPLDGSVAPYPVFDGRTLSGVNLSAGTFAVFRIDR
jgi:hypothetical protein